MFGSKVLGGNEHVVPCITNLERFKVEAVTESDFLFEYRCICVSGHNPKRKRQVKFVKICLCVGEVVRVFPTHKPKTGHDRVAY